MGSIKFPGCRDRTSREFGHRPVGWSGVQVLAQSLYRGLMVSNNCGLRLFTFRIRKPMDFLSGLINSRMTEFKLKGQTSPRTFKTPSEAVSFKSGLNTPTGSDGLPGGLISLFPDDNKSTRTEFKICILPSLSSELTVIRPTSAAAANLKRDFDILKNSLIRRGHVFDYPREQAPIFADQFNLHGLTVANLDVHAKRQMGETTFDMGPGAMNWIAAGFVTGNGCRGVCRESCGVSVGSGIFSGTFRWERSDISFSRRNTNCLRCKRDHCRQVFRRIRRGDRTCSWGCAPSDQSKKRGEKS